MSKSNLNCGFKDNLPIESITGHFLVYIDDLFEEKLYKKCTNYFFDEVANAGLFAKLAEQHGAVGILAEGNNEEEKVYFWLILLLIL